VKQLSSRTITKKVNDMLVGELTTFKSYRKKNNLLARQMDVKFIIKNESPKKSVVGEAGDYLTIDDNGDLSVVAKDEFETTYVEVE
jgi:hypothetical protein